MRVLIAAIALIVSPMASPAFAQAADIPRTTDGKPDFHGYWFSGFLTPMERPDKIATLAVGPEDEARIIALTKEELKESEVYDPEFDTTATANVLLEMNGEKRSSLIVEPADGKLPLTVLAQAALKQDEEGFDNPEDRPTAERCMDSLVNAPLAASWLLIPIQFMLTPDALVMRIEDLDPVRIVSLSDAPRPDALRTRGGQSRGRWEGDTLVVETDSFAIRSRQGLTWSGGAFITADSKVIERFSLLGTNALLYQFTVEDPSLYARPWRAEYVLTRIARPVYEYACHEGNHALIHILTAARLGKQEEAAD
jgi:hypothetical protein